MDLQLNVGKVPYLDSLYCHHLDIPFSISPTVGLGRNGVGQHDRCSCFPRCNAPVRCYPIRLQSFSYSETRR